MAFGHAGDEMVEGADAAARDDRDADRIRDRAGEREVVAVLRAVAVHRGDEQFAGAEGGEADGVFARVDAGRFAAAVGEDFPARRPIAFWFDAARVDAADRELAADSIGDGGEAAGAADRGHGNRRLLA